MHHVITNWERVINSNKVPLEGLFTRDLPNTCYVVAVHHRPSIDTFNKLLEFARRVGSFDGGDQGLLNLYFDKWATEDIGKHLPFTYNLAAHAFYSYIPAYKQFGDKVR